MNYFTPLITIMATKGCTQASLVVRFEGYSFGDLKKSAILVNCIPEFGVKTWKRESEMLGGLLSLDSFFVF